MTTPNFVILYVDSPEKSGAFYASLLGRQPVEASPTFAMFVLDNGFKLGLWSRHTVEPAAAAAGGGASSCLRWRMRPRSTPRMRTGRNGG